MQIKHDVVAPGLDQVWTSCKLEKLLFLTWEEKVGADSLDSMG